MFQKGQSGNPGGRPKGTAGLCERIRKETQDGDELVTIMLGMARGDNRFAQPRDIIAAVKWLSEYGFGKPVEQVEHSVDESLEGLIAGSYPKKLSE